MQSVKAIGLSRENILCSAEAVNQHLQATAKDRWLVAIPSYHVGGLAIYARALVSGASTFVLQGKWSAHAFHQSLIDQRITLSSLVPTQVHDLVEHGLTSPPSLRAVVIGGAALDPQLYRRARRLGWPLLPSYGLSECASQIATASLTSLTQDEFPALEVLTHAQVELREQRVYVKSNANTGLIAVGRSEGQFSLEDPRRAGWLATEDLAEWSKSDLKILGRRDDVLKILGVLVPVLEVEHAARAFFATLSQGAQLNVLAIPHPRSGSQLILFTDSPASLREWQAQLTRFNQNQPGPRRLSGFCWVPKILRNEMGKVPKNQLRELFA